MTETLTLPTRAETRDRRIPVAVLGATGSVGQRFVQLLEAHPWFRLHEAVASERSAGRSYGDAADWRLDTLLPSSAAVLEVKPLGAELESRLVFSLLNEAAFCMAACCSGVIWRPPPAPRPRPCPPPVAPAAPPGPRPRFPKWRGTKRLS